MKKILLLSLSVAASLMFTSAYARDHYVCVNKDSAGYALYYCLKDGSSCIDTGSEKYYATYNIGENTTMTLYDVHLVISGNDNCNFDSILLQAGDELHYSGSTIWKPSCEIRHGVCTG